MQHLRVHTFKSIRHMFASAQARPVTAHVELTEVRLPWDSPGVTFFFQKGKRQYPSGNPWKVACSSRFNSRPGHARWPKWPTNYLCKHSQIQEALVASVSPQPSWQVALAQTLSNRMVFGGFPRNSDFFDRLKSCLRILAALHLMA